MATIRTNRAQDWGAGIALSFSLALVGCALVGCTANHPQDADQLRELDELVSLGYFRGIVRKLGGKLQRPR